MSDEAVEVDFKGLDALIKSLKGRMPIGRVGILGDKNARSDSNTNAAVGARHEYGIGVVRRSFLRMPISENMQKYLDEAGAFDKDILSKIIKTGSLTEFVSKVCVVAENIVGDAFASGGFGKWAPWKDSSYQNNTGQLLVDTQQLRNSITSDVK